MPDEPNTLKSAFACTLRAVSANRTISVLGQTLAAIRSELGSVLILVNNAGISHFKTFLEVTRPSGCRPSADLTRSSRSTGSRFGMVFWRNYQLICQ
jgi:NAD(P)-dependent dehydrogenase (short-subunit alcohol dehydrogenase family)